MPPRSVLVQERRRRKRHLLNTTGAVLFFDLSIVVEQPRSVVVSSAKLVLTLEGGGRVAVLQRVLGGRGISLNTLLLEGEGRQVELEVGHAVQGWLLEPRLNLGLEVQGEVRVGEATLLINSQVCLKFI